VARASLNTSQVVLFTTYLTSKPQPQSHRPQPRPDDPSFIRPWIDSLSDVAARAATAAQRSGGGESGGGITGVVLHDELSDGFVRAETRRAPAVRFERVDNGDSLSNNDARYEMLLERLASLSSDELLVFLTDGADVRLLSDPRQTLARVYKPARLFIGSEFIDADDASIARAERAEARARSLLGAFAPGTGHAERAREYARGTRLLLNPGVLGGAVPVVRLALCVALGAMRCADATAGGGSNANTPAFYTTLPTFMPHAFFTGHPLHTRFGAHEGQGEGAVFAHK
jgi:hypothetical protein